MFRSEAQRRFATERTQGVAGVHCAWMTEKGQGGAARVGRGELPYRGVLTRQEEFLVPRNPRRECPETSSKLGGKAGGGLEIKTQQQNKNACLNLGQD